MSVANGSTRRTCPTVRQSPAHHLRRTALPHRAARSEQGVNRGHRGAEPVEAVRLVPGRQRRLVRGRRPASSSRCWARRARARARSCGSSPGWSRPTRASVELTGEDATSLPVQQRGVGFVFQHYALFRHMTVRQNIAFGLEVRKLPRAEIKARVDELLELVQLSGYAEPLPLAALRRPAAARGPGAGLAPRPKVLCSTSPSAPSTPRSATSCAPGSAGSTTRST